MKNLALKALCGAVLLSLAACNSNTDGASSTTTKINSAASKSATLSGKFDGTTEYLYVRNKTLSDNEFKLKNKNNNYVATVELQKGEFEFYVGNATGSVDGTFGPAADTPIVFGTPVEMQKGAKGAFKIRIVMSGNYDFSLDYTKDVPTIKVLRSTKKVAVKRLPPDIPCDKWNGGPITVPVAKAWPNGTKVRDSYSGKVAIVKNGKVTMQPAPESEGILLLEEAKNYTEAPFSWNNANVYFLLTDRFNNGDTSNDHSYGRKSDGEDNIGTWHGGDFSGIVQKLDYLKSLGANAIWVTPIVEQVHGFVGGGTEQSFPFYGYHGYWALDFTKIDKNLGTEEDFQRFVDEAHKRGIRVLVDVVMNHAGSITLKDLQDLGMDDLIINKETLPDDYSDYKPKGYFASWASVNSHIDRENKPAWKKWWGPSWVRAGLPGYDPSGDSEITETIAGLPDFKTEQLTPVSLPEFLKHKADTNAKELSNATVVDYLVSWHSYYVRKFGIDGFRCDTVKHVDAYAWKKLHDSATVALKEWKAENPTKKLDDLPFFMVGEVYDQGVVKDPLWFNNGFQSLINFDYQKEATVDAQCMASAETAYARYAKAVADPGFNVLSYISSHDTKLFFSDYQDFDFQKRAANSFLMLPGQVQTYYGDESGRKLMKHGGYMDQSLRSDMNWNDISKAENAGLIAHWSKLQKFRLVHPAVAEGTHTRISKKPYAFMRVKGKDKVVVASAGRK